MLSRLTYLSLKLAVLLIFKDVYLRAEEIPNVDQLISKIAQHEQPLQNIRSNLLITIPDNNTTFVEGEWRYSYGREYLGGIMYLNVPTISKKVAKPFKFAFDGDKMRIYGYDPLKKRDNGRITSLEPVNFTGYPTMNALLGHDVHRSGRLTIAEGLRQAKEIHIQPTMQMVTGHKCYVIDAVEIDKSPTSVGIPCDVRLWIDPERDFRLLRLEKYFSADANDPGRWKRLMRRVDNIKLVKINGIWIPVEGEFHNFNAVAVPRPGLTEEDYKKMSHEEALRNLDYELKPIVPMRLVRIDPKSVTFGKDIPSSKFTIDWPQGTWMWDDFAQLGYIVGEVSVDMSTLGEPRSKMAETTSNAVRARKEGKTSLAQAQGAKANKHHTSTAVSHKAIIPDGDGPSWWKLIATLSAIGIGIVVAVIFLKKFPHWGTVSE